MKLIIDDANIEKIKELYEYYPIVGVTTNPSILASVGKRPYEVLKEIRAFIGKEEELHVQVISDKAEMMVEEAKIITGELGENTYIKIPSNKEGIKAMKLLSRKGYNVTATAIYTAMQAYLAASAGAKYAAPYVNRIDNLGYDGIEVAKEIDDIFKMHQLDCEVLAASFKNVKQVLELTKYGIGAATIAPDIIESFVSQAAVDKAVNDFTQDFENLCGQGKSMKDL